MRRIASLLILLSTVALGACDTIVLPTAPAAAKADSAVVPVVQATFSPLASSNVSVTPGSYAQNAFTMCLPRGSRYTVTLTSDSPAVIADGWGMTQPTTITNCNEQTQDEISIYPTVRGAYLGSADISVTVQYSTIDNRQGLKSFQYVAYVDSPNKG